MEIVYHADMYSSLVLFVKTKDWRTVTRCKRTRAGGVRTCDNGPRSPHSPSTARNVRRPTDRLTTWRIVDVVLQFFHKLFLVSIGNTITYKYSRAWSTRPRKINDKDLIVCKLFRSPQIATCVAISLRLCQPLISFVTNDVIRPEDAVNQP